MRRRDFLFAALGFWVVPCLVPGAADGAGLELKDGDRIVLVGDDLIERDQKSGYLETLLTLRNPDKNVTFRNLGWSGDTVFGDARAGFGTQVDGFRHLKEHVVALKPTVVIVGYGMSESFDGEAGLANFERGLGALLDVISTTGARVVLLSPIAHQDLGPPLPDPTEHNRRLRLYRDAIDAAARSRGYPAVDLLSRPAVLSRRPGVDLTPLGWTDDGIHLNDPGYWYYGASIANELSGGPVPACRVNVRAGGKVECLGGTISGFRRSPRAVRFELLASTLPPPAPPAGAAGDDPANPGHRLFQFEGLEPGEYTLRIDGKKVADGRAGAWESRRIRVGPEFDQVDALRKAIKEKNLLYFYRWRPQNETYLFGFRKHEQGNNAREIPQFDPLVEAKEQEIARLRVPASHVYELVRESEVGR